MDLHKTTITTTIITITITTITPYIPKADSGVKSLRAKVKDINTREVDNLVNTGPSGEGAWLCSLAYNNTCERIVIVTNDY